MKTLILLSLFILVSCSDDSFKKVERLESFRILAIQASAPEVAPGGSANLRLYISDVNGGGRVINGTTVSCIDPGIAFGAPVSCDHDSSAVNDTYTINTGADGDLGVANLYTGLATDTVSVTVPGTILTGRSATDQFNGVGYITIFSFTVDGREVTAFKRVVATNRATLNSNPTGSAILLNGAAIGAAPAKDDKLKVTTSVAETYDYITAEGVTETRTEEYQVAWYVTQGKFDKPKAKITETVEYQGDAPTASSLVLAIVRDERGGLDVVREVFP